MLPATERLTRSGLFQRAYTARKTISSPLVALYVLPKTKPAGSKGGAAGFKPSENPSVLGVKSRFSSRMPLVGFVVAKKVCKSAVVRNRAKRRLREAYRLLRQSDRAAAISLNQWYALVWVITEKTITASWEEIKDTVLDCLTRANAKFGAQAHNPARSQQAKTIHKHDDEAGKKK